MFGFASATRLVALAVSAFVLISAPARAEPNYPAPNGTHVVDAAHILPAQTQADLEQKLQDLETKTTDQMVVITVPSLQGNSIEDYGYQLGRKFSGGVGQKAKDNGVIFLVAPTEHKVRIEVGYGLEGTLTDTLAFVIVQDKVLPKFRAGDLPGGVTDGVNAVINQLTLDQPQAAANVAAAEAAQHAAPVRHSHGFPIQAIFFLIILFVVVGRLGFWPLFLLGGLRGGGWSGGGGWSSGGGGFGGGGGFSGGGGSFGGGGASGSW
ncbi:MAG TPA: TPM domain-containing protein [Caulobacteraceae bacterium]|jgi:uncharacterized protein|nr:TPM domain-containing protein [Caulobacteraceae bacterium]